MTPVNVGTTKMAADCDSMSTLNRTKTMPLSTSRSPRMSPETIRRKVTSLSNDRLKNAKTIAENAVKSRKIFTIQGPYPFVRESLRNRGWVEQFYQLNQPSFKAVTCGKKLKESNDNNSSDSDNDENDYTCDGDGNFVDPNDYGGQVAPWEEENGIYGITSRLVRNATPTFIWGIRRDCVDTKSLKKDQIINHYGHASFTTKVGLCTHLRDLPWFEQTSSETFFPRCYRLSHDEDKEAFIDDYVLTACVSLLKHIVAENNMFEGQDIKTPVIPVSAVAVNAALEHCRQYLRSLNNEDLDIPTHELSEIDKNQLIQWHYKIVLDKTPVLDVDRYRDEILAVLSAMKQQCSQYDIDGIRNVWIVKPGAKSRGRGIQCYNRLEDILKLVNTQIVQKDSKFVVQKYIERPLLIYRTKFDIRQWFVVTDWNPFTMWFYKDCYLRFCSQEFSLDTFDESVHLSNNSIQKNYKNGQRASELPDDNMWHCHDFKEYLREKNYGDVWDSVVYPGMKNAVICSLLCCQDDIEQRKNAFELYGADFMLDENCYPWLIEINSSPCMAASTKVTAMMCRSVLEDTMKVVLDRRSDKNADTGLFELAYRQQVVSVPTYVGISLQVDGQYIRKPNCGGVLTSRKETHSLEGYSDECRDAQTEVTSISKVHDKALRSEDLSAAHSPTIALRSKVKSMDRTDVNKSKNGNCCTLEKSATTNSVVEKLATCQTPQKSCTSYKVKKSMSSHTVQKLSVSHALDKSSAISTMEKPDNSSAVEESGANSDRDIIHRNQTSVNQTSVNRLYNMPTYADNDTKENSNVEAQNRVKGNYVEKVQTVTNTYYPSMLYRNKLWKNENTLVQSTRTGSPDASTKLHITDKVHHRRHHRHNRRRRQWHRVDDTDKPVSPVMLTQTTDIQSNISVELTTNDSTTVVHAQKKHLVSVGPSGSSNASTVSDQKPVTTSYSQKPSTPTVLGIDGLPSYSHQPLIYRRSVATSFDMSRLSANSQFLSLAHYSPDACGIREKQLEKVSGNASKCGENCVSYVPHLVMPYFASRAVGGRRAILVPDVTKIKFSQSTPQFSSSRLVANNHDIMQLHKTISITGIGNSTANCNPVICATNRPIY